MNVKQERKFEEKIISLKTSPKLLIYTCVTESGKIFLIRQPCEVIWIHSANKQKFYDVVWHPSKEFFLAFYCADSQNFAKLISVESGKEITCRKIDDKIINAKWFGMDLQSSEFLEKFDRDLIGNFRLDFNYKALSDDILIDQDISILFLSFNDYSILYLQGMIPFIKIENKIHTCAIGNNFETLILLSEERKIFVLDLKMHENSISEAVYIYKNFLILKSFLTFLNDWLETYKRDYIRKLLKFVRFLKIHGDKKSLIQEFSQLYFFGKISPELQHKISTSSHYETISEAHETAQNMNTIWSSFCKIQLVLEKALSLCEIMAGSYSSNDFPPKLILSEITDQFTKIYDWSFTTIKHHFNKNLVDGWRIFTTWLVYINKFSTRSNKNKFFDSAVFENLSDIGNDKEIRKKLIDFILNDLENCARNNVGIYSENIPKLDDLKTLIDKFENNFHMGFSKNVNFEFFKPLEQFSTYYMRGSNPMDSFDFYNPLNCGLSYFSIISPTNKSVLLFRTSLVNNSKFEFLLCNNNTEIISSHITSYGSILVLHENGILSVKKISKENWHNCLPKNYKKNETETVELFKMEIGSKPALVEYFHATNSVIITDENNFLKYFQLENY